MKALKSRSIILLGDTNVGKTALIQRYIENAFYGENTGTVGIDFCTKDFTSKQEKFKDQEFKVKIWDTAGMERFRTLTHAFYKRNDAVIVVFDLTDRASFDHVQSWLSAIETHASANVPMLLIGTKLDLESERNVSTEEGQQYANNLGIEYKETSSCTGSGIEEAFELIIENSILYKYQKAKEDLVGTFSANKDGTGSIKKSKDQKKNNNLRHASKKSSSSGERSSLEDIIAQTA